MRKIAGRRVVQPYVARELLEGLAEWNHAIDFLGGERGMRSEIVEPWNMEL